MYTYHPVLESLIISRPEMKQFKMVKAQLEKIQEAVLIQAFITEFTPCLDISLTQQQKNNGYLPVDYLRAHQILHIEDATKKQINNQDYITKSSQQQTSQIFLQSPNLLRQALTINKPYAYENLDRLAFLGDSAINILTILELFLMFGDYLTEKQLDQEKCKMLSNNGLLAKISQHNFQNYVIDDRINDCAKYKIDALKSFNYLQSQIKKTAIRNQITYLRQSKIKLQVLIANQLKKLIGKHLDQSYIDMVISSAIETFLKNSKISAFLVDSIKNLKLMKRIDNIHLNKDLEPEIGLACNVIEKLIQIILQLIQKCQSKLNYIRSEQQRVNIPPSKVQETQVEAMKSVVGLIIETGDLSRAQVFLRNLGILILKFEEFPAKLEYIKGQNNFVEGLTDLQSRRLVDMFKIEGILGYKYKDQIILFRSLAHKSYRIKQSEKIFNNEKQEFIGDAIMNYLISKEITDQTKDSDIQVNSVSKILHEKKTCLINNIILSLITIEMGLDKFIVYADDQDIYIQEIKKSAETIRQAVQQKNLNQLSRDYQKLQEMKQSGDQEQYENQKNRLVKDLDILIDIASCYHQKQLSDAFEAIVGGIFLDSGSLQETYEFLMRFIGPNIPLLTDLDIFCYDPKSTAIRFWDQYKLSQFMKINIVAQQKKIINSNENEQQFQQQIEGSETYSCRIGEIEIISFQVNEKFKNKERHVYLKFYRYLKELFYVNNPSYNISKNELISICQSQRHDEKKFVQSVI
ncbi:dicer 2 [Stylonychia lemnae]|uniref:Dicer 2 n=1 Tax=Stylonychia lemnae TaxID=5949 RepID=A0A078B512_STYLE|nr:dicer 2 [Stylonychia lemnae]|eukprot:CDW89615.1 dicer 2 [Stylonychia lemnae]